MMAAAAYNNLGVNLSLVGQWDRAHEAYEHALALIEQVDEHDEKVPMALDSLGELSMLRGDLDGAKDYLERAVALASGGPTSGTHVKRFGPWRGATLPPAKPIWR